MSRRKKDRKIVTPKGVGPGEVWTEFVADKDGNVSFGHDTVVPIQVLYDAYAATFPGKVTELVDGKFRLAVEVELLKKSAAALRSGGSAIIREEEMVSGLSTNRLVHEYSIGVKTSRSTDALLRLTNK